MTSVKEDWLATCEWLKVLKYDWIGGRQDVWRLEEELDKDAVCHQFCSNFYSECFTKEALEWLGNFKIGGKIIKSLKYADDLVLLAKEEKVLQDTIDRLIEIGGCYGMEMNVEKTKVMRISRQLFPVKIMIGQKQLESVESFKYLGSVFNKWCKMYLWN